MALVRLEEKYEIRQGKGFAYPTRAIYVNPEDVVRVQDLQTGVAHFNDVDVHLRDGTVISVKGRPDAIAETLNSAKTEEA